MKVESYLPDQYIYTSKFYCTTNVDYALRVTNNYNNMIYKYN